VDRGALQIPVTVVVASNAEYGVVKEFGVWETAPGVPGLDVPGLDVVAAGIADRDRPTLINARTIPVGV
jgi:benzoylformate decarboxylase